MNALSPPCTPTISWYGEYPGRPTEGRFLPINGGTMRGPIYLAADPTRPMMAATKRYVDERIELIVGGQADIDGGRF